MLSSEAVSTAHVNLILQLEHEFSRQNNLYPAFMNIGLTLEKVVAFTCETYFDLLITNCFLNLFCLLYQN